MTETAAAAAAELIAAAADRATALVSKAAENAASLVIAAADRARDPSVVLLIQRIDERTENTEKSVDKLLHAMFEGNGQPSVFSQLATLTERSKNDRRQIAALFGMVLGLIGGTNLKL